MKFIYTAGDYTTRDGVTFLFRNPSEVENKATIERLLKDPSFRRCDEEAEKTVLSDECPKCGRIVVRGKYMHQKYCRGRA